MSHAGPPPYNNPNPGNRHESDEFRARQFFHGTPQWQQDQYAQQPGGMPGEHVRQRQAEEQHIHDSARRAFYAANPPTGYAGTTGARSIHRPQPVYPNLVPTAPPAVSRATKSWIGVKAVIGLVVLAVLVAGGAYIFRHATKEVTLAEMGIKDQSFASWSRDLNSVVFYDVTFRVNTKNTSDEDRKVKLCSRMKPGTKDKCITYTVRAHSTKTDGVIMTGTYGADDQNTTGPDAKIVKVDGFKVRA